MDIDNIVDALEENSKFKYYKFATDKGPTSCARYLAHEGKYYRKDEAPALPIHPNCKCKLELIDSDHWIQFKMLKISELQKIVPLFFLFSENRCFQIAEIRDRVRRTVSNRGIPADIEAAIRGRNRRGR